jgi:hypothetical protein
MRRVEITPVVTHKMATLANNGQCLIKILLIGGHLIPDGQATGSHLVPGNVPILLQIFAASPGLVLPCGRRAGVRPWVKCPHGLKMWMQEIFAITLDKCPMLG